MNKLKEFIPPIFATIYHQFITFGEAEFSKWWYKARVNTTPQLTEIVDEFLASPSKRLVSKYWWYLAKKNIEQINEYGVEGYLNTVGRNYYTWTGIFGDMDNCPDVEVSLTELLEKKENLSLQESVLHNVILAYLNGCMGEAFRSQEEAMAFHEMKTITNHVMPASVLEIGAGSGRTAHQFLSRLTRLKYTIVDIPPASYIASQQLKGHDVQFLLPHEIDKMPKVDLAVAVDCLSEMKPDVVKGYLDYIKRSAKWFYFTAWGKIKVPFDNATYKYTDFILGEIRLDKPCLYPSVMREVLCKL